MRDPCAHTRLVGFRKTIMVIWKSTINMSEMTKGWSRRMLKISVQQGRSE